jgi:hypothetical protein
MKIRYLKNSNDAIVGVIVAILIVGLCVTVVSIIQVVYVPEWMYSKEAEHMDEVADQFANLKYTLDIQSTIEQDVPISTPIKLGSKELPFFSSVRAFGILKIVSDEYAITISNNSNSFTYTIGIIKYSSANVYFINQNYIYEAGSVVLNQSPEPHRNVMNANPLFSVNNSGEVNISFTIINISCISGKASISGYRTYQIQTCFLDSSIRVFLNIKNITIVTNYPDSWKTFFNNTFGDSGLTYGNDFTIFELTGGIKLEFSDSITVNLTPLQLIDLRAQIGAGWIQ